MKKNEYHEYLKSDAWLARRDACLEFWGNRCALCNEGFMQMEVHHRTYERVGNEVPTDLIALCSPCHKKMHGKLPDFLEPVFKLPPHRQWILPPPLPGDPPRTLRDIKRLVEEAKARGEEPLYEN